MSKGNMFLGFARGKVGSVVFTRSGGEQVTRARNTEPKNPRTAAQALQRSVLKTVSQAYSLLSPICDHSFEGLQEGTPNQSRFSQLNVNLLRNVNAFDVNFSDPSTIISSQATNFALRETTYPVINEYIVSQGSLPSTSCGFSGSGLPYLELPGLGAAATGTYQEVCDALGANPGDQLTFLWVYGDDSTADRRGLCTGFEFSRVILMPANGEMNTFFVGNNGAVNSPNENNQGRIYLGQIADARVNVQPAENAAGSDGSPRVILAFTAILSRKIGATWRRSQQSLSIREEDLSSSPKIWLLGDAALSFMNSEAGSSLYLNQAVGG